MDLRQQFRAKINLEKPLEKKIIESNNPETNEFESPNKMKELNCKIKNVLSNSEKAFEKF